MQPVIAEFTKETGIAIGGGAGHLDLRRAAAGDGGGAVALAAVRLHPYRFQHDPVARLGRLSRAARRIHQEIRLQIRRRRRLRQLHEIRRAHLRRADRRQRAHPVHAQGSDRQSGQQEALRRQVRHGAEGAGDLGREPAAAGIPHGSVEGPLRLGQPAQPRQRRDLVVHDLLQRRRLPVRRRHEADAGDAGRRIRRRPLSAGQEGQPSGSGELGHAANDPAHRARPRGELPVLGRHLQDDQEPEAIEDGRPVLLQRGAGLEVHRQNAAPLDLLAARGDPDQQIHARAKRRPPTSRCGSAPARTAFRSSPIR